MIRPLALGLLLTVSCAVAFSPAQAAPNFAVSGNVVKGCSLTAANATLTVARSGSISVTAAPSSITASCNAATGGTLSVSSTRLQKSGSPTTFSDYTLSVAGWGSAITYTTAAAPPAATTRSSATQTATLSFSCTSGCTNTQIANNTTWTATITLGLTPNP